MLNLKEYKVEDYFDVAIFSIVAFYPELYKYIWVVFARLGLGFIASNISYIIWGVFILIFMPVFPQRLNKIDALIYIGISVILSLFSFFPWHNAFTWTRYFEFVSGVLPFFILGRAYRYNDKHEDLMLLLASVTLVLAIIYTVFFVINDEGLGYDGMFAAYNILYSILILITAFFKKKAYIYRCLAIVGVLYLLLLGTRGPFVCVCVFFILMLLKHLGSSKMVIFSIIAILLFNVFMASPLYESSLESLSKAAEEHGFSTRILDFIEREDFLNLSGRDTIQGRVINEIKKNPFEIRGPYSDRIIISKHYDYSVQEAEQKETYAHNFIIEMWTHYGIFFGSILVIFVVISTLKLIMKTDKNKCFITYSVVVCGLVMLLFSSSYLLKESFFFLMGICFNENFTKKME